MLKNILGSDQQMSVKRGRVGPQILSAPQVKIRFITFKYTLMLPLKFKLWLWVKKASQFTLQFFPWILKITMDLYFHPAYNLCNKKKPYFLHSSAFCTCSKKLQSTIVTTYEVHYSICDPILGKLKMIFVYKSQGSNVSNQSFENTKLHHL